MTQGKNRKLIAFVVMAYMLIALIWWTVLLNKKNDEAFDAKISLIEGSVELDMQEGLIKELKEKYKRQKMMILGEGAVFGIMLVLGILMILKSFNRELAVAQKENNFLLSITHELKSPIASIQLILDTFKKRTLKPALFNELNDNALEETLRLNALVGNLLYANKLNYGQHYQFEHIDISSLCQNVFNHFRKSHPNTNLQSTIQENITAKVDSDAIKIALNNLLENAIKYSDSDPCIELILKFEQKLTVLVKDQGIGITKAEKEKVFSKFYRSGNEETRISQGTGLGLYITSEIIKGHKGDITILDNHPKGTIFKITQPNIKNGK